MEGAALPKPARVSTQVRLARRITAEERREARARDAAAGPGNAADTAQASGAARADQHFVQVFAKDTTPAAGSSVHAGSGKDSPAGGELTAFGPMPTSAGAALCPPANSSTVVVGMRNVRTGAHLPWRPL